MTTRLVATNHSLEFEENNLYPKLILIQIPPPKRPTLWVLGRASHATPHLRVPAGALAGDWWQCCHATYPPLLFSYAMFPAAYGGGRGSLLA